MMWKFENIEITDIEQFPELTVGFVYKITDKETNKFYVGKKILMFTKTKKISKREKKETKTRKKTVKVSSESDWKTYYGSCKALLEDVKKYGEQRFKREILELCISKKHLSYCEIKWQILLNVLESNSYNENILGKFFREDLW
jgi:hypothetical protein